jgi:hypothetical protein
VSIYVIKYEFYCFTFCFNLLFDIVEINIPYLQPEEFDGPAVSAPRRAIAEVKQHWSVIGWETKNNLSRAPPCLGRHVAVVPG